MSDAQPAPHSAGLRGGCAPCPEPFLLYLAPAYQPREAQPPPMCARGYLPVQSDASQRDARALSTPLALTSAHTSRRRPARTSLPACPAPLCPVRAAPEVAVPLALRSAGLPVASRRRGLSSRASARVCLSTRLSCLCLLTSY